MNCPSLKFDRRLSANNTFRVNLYGLAYCEIEGIVKVTDQSEPVRIKLMCKNTRGHGTHGAGTRFMFRIDESRFAVESGAFLNEDGTPANLPRMGLVLVDVPESCQWLNQWEPDSKTV